ncbi:chlorohydrolase [Streptococcus pneumoniae]|nr:chlorohydrolase [Streptococcus pneumoniae]
MELTKSAQNTVFEVVDETDEDCFKVVDGTDEVSSKHCF